MPVHTFPIESVHSPLGAASIESAYLLVRTYLSQHNQLGETDDSYMKCPDRAAVINAISKFGNWSRRLPQNEPKLLWLSLHGKKPSNEKHLGTRAVSASRTDNKAEVVDWWDVFGGLCGACPPNVVIIMDVCWGGSPSAPASLTRRTGNPRLLFGPTRSAHQLELDTATGLIVATLVDGAVPSVRRAQTLVNILNKSFPKDAHTYKDFYRVWWWNQDGTQGRFPQPRPTVKRAR